MRTLFISTLLLLVCSLSALADATDTAIARLNEIGLTLDSSESGGWRLKGMKGVRQRISQDQLETAVEIVSTVEDVSAIWFNETTFDDLSPLASLPLKRIWLSSYNPNLTDLSPLSGMSLTNLVIDNAPVESLEPLRGMPLKVLHANYTTAESLDPLIGMDLEILSIAHAENISDLSPIAGMPLKTLWLNGATGITDLSPIAGIALTKLRLDRLPLADIDAIRGMPLERLSLDFMPTPVSLDPLRGMTLERLDISYTDAEIDLSPLADAQVRRLMVFESENLVGGEALKGRDDIDIRGATDAVLRQLQ